MYKMNFSELSFDRNFTIKTHDTAPPRQIDVFAKDDETIFLIECTHAEEYSQKSVKPQIDKINGLKADAVKCVQQHYGRDKKYKIKWGICLHHFSLYQ